ncbi:MAG: hypothetical protein U0414_15095 [Polyangiaceae bacterium]
MPRANDPLEAGPEIETQPIPWSCADEVLSELVGELESYARVREKVLERLDLRAARRARKLVELLLSAEDDAAGIAALLEECHMVLSSAGRESVAPPAGHVSGAHPAPPASSYAPRSAERRSTRSFPIPAPLYTDDEPTLPGNVVSGARRHEASSSSLRLDSQWEEQLARAARPSPSADEDSLPAVLRLVVAPREAPSTEPSASTPGGLDYEDEAETSTGVPQNVMQSYMLEVAKRTGNAR